MKTYNLQYNIGRAKYCVSFHDGIKIHSDGSPFFDLKIFKNKRLCTTFINELISMGYEN